MLAQDAQRERNELQATNQRLQERLREEEVQQQDMADLQAQVQRLQARLCEEENTRQDMVESDFDTLMLSIYKVQQCRKR